MMYIKRVLLEWFLNFLIKNPFCLEINLLLVVVLKRKISETKNQLQNYKIPFIKKIKKKKVHSSFIESTWGDDLADIKLISKFNKGLRFSLCVIDIYSKYV